MARSLANDEDASAAVELVVLLPVYVLLLTGLLFAGHAVVVRQGVVLATRFRAWDTRGALDETSLSKAFFPTYHKDGPPAGEGRFKADKKSDGFILANKKLSTLAGTLLDGGGSLSGETLLRKMTVTGRFPYRATFPGLTEPVTPKATAVTLLPGNLTRGVHIETEELGQKHPIEDFYASPDRALKPGSAKPDLYLSPNDLPPGVDPDEEDGLWKRGLRLGGNKQEERKLFKRQLGFP